MKNKIKSIDPSSPLRGRVRQGWALVAINGHAIHDVLDYKFYSYEPELTLEFMKDDGRLALTRVKKREGEDLGLDFGDYLMDAPRRCANRCVFCFIDQLPKGMRPTMYFKDDDARLSFLLGNYITLTNLTPREMERIIALRISPINVSVHTMRPELCSRMMGNPRAGERLEYLREMARAGITLNCQIVCCPGINDGEELKFSMAELAKLSPAVHSVSIVPVGLTAHRQGLAELKPFTKELAASTVKLVTEFGDECLKKHGERIFFCSDELYILAGLPIPPEEFYEDFAQLDNGVGTLRLLEAEFSAALEASEPPSDTEPFTVACGVSAAPYIRELIDRAREKYPSVRGEVIPIYNDFFGRSIDVSGLVTGRDLTAQLRGRSIGARVLITSSMLRRDEQDFLDGMTREEASRQLGAPVYPVEPDGGMLCEAVLGRLPELPTPKRGEDVHYYKYEKM